MIRSRGLVPIDDTVGPIAGTRTPAWDGQAVHWTNGRLPELTERRLSRAHRIAYLLRSEAWPQIESAPPAPPKIKETSHGDLDLFFSFYERVYIERFAGTEGRPIAEDHRRMAEAYFAKELRSYYFLKNGRTAACLLLNHNAHHADLEEPTLHIGFAGYEADLLNCDETQWIRERFTQLIANNRSGTEVVTARIYSYNEASLRAFAKRGAAIVGYWLQPLGD